MCHLLHFVLGKISSNLRTNTKYKCLYKGALQLLSCFKNEKEDCVKEITFLNKIYVH